MQNLGRATSADNSMSRLHRQTHNRAWERIRQQVFAERGRRCFECGGAGRLEVHHVIPLHRGGSNHPSNLRPICRGCHIAMHSKPVTGWGRLVAELK